MGELIGPARLERLRLDALFEELRRRVGYRLARRTMAPEPFRWRGRAAALGGVSHEAMLRWQGRQTHG